MVMNDISINTRVVIIINSPVKNEGINLLPDISTVSLNRLGKKRSVHITGISSEKNP